MLCSRRDQPRHLLSTSGAAQSTTFSRTSRRVPAKSLFDDGTELRAHPDRTVPEGSPRPAAVAQARPSEWRIRKAEWRHGRRPDLAPLMEF